MGPRTLKTATVAIAFLSILVLRPNHSLALPNYRAAAPWLEDGKQEELVQLIAQGRGDEAIALSEYSPCCRLDDIVLREAQRRLYWDIGDEEAFRLFQAWLALFPFDCSQGTGQPLDDYWKRAADGYVTLAARRSAMGLADTVMAENLRAAALFQELGDAAQSYDGPRLMPSVLRLIEKCPRSQFTAQAVLVAMNHDGASDWLSALRRSVQRLERVGSPPRQQMVLLIARASMAASLYSETGEAGVSAAFDELRRLESSPARRRDLYLAEAGTYFAAANSEEFKSLPPTPEVKAQMAAIRSMGRSILERVATVEPDHPERIRSIIIGSFLDDAQPAVALAELRRFERTSLGEDYTDNYFTVGRYYIESGENLAALDLMTEIERRHPSFPIGPRAALLAGDALYRLGREAEAEAAWCRAAASEYKDDGSRRWSLFGGFEAEAASRLANYFDGKQQWRDALEWRLKTSWGYGCGTGLVEYYQRRQLQIMGYLRTLGLQDDKAAQLIESTVLHGYEGHREMIHWLIDARRSQGRDLQLFLNAADVAWRRDGHGGRAVLEMMQEIWKAQPSTQPAR